MVLNFAKRSGFCGDGFCMPEIVCLPPGEQFKMHVEDMKIPSGDGRHSFFFQKKATCKL